MKPRTITTIAQILQMLNTLALILICIDWSFPYWKRYLVTAMIVINVFIGLSNNFELSSITNKEKKQ